MMKYVLSAILFATPAAAQMQCASYDEINEALTTTHGESPLVVAMSPRGVIVFYGNPDSGSWTMVVVANGQGCVPAHGVGFEQFDPAPGGDPS